MDKICRNCKKSPATIVCGACKALLCSECDTSIHNNKIFASHKREKLESQTIAFSMTMCSKHNDPILAVCEDCKEKCCLSCITECHVGHSIIQHEVHSKKCEEKEENIKKDFETFINLAKETSSIVENEISELEQCGKLTVSRINEDFQKMSQQLQKRKDELIKDMTEKTDKLKETIKTTQQKICECNSEAENVIKEVENMKSTEDNPQLFNKCVDMERISQKVDSSVNELVKVIQGEFVNLCYSDDNVEKVGTDIDSFCSFNINKKYENESNVLAINSSINESGKSVLDLSETSVKVVWNSIPKVIDSLVQKNECINYVLEYKEIIKIVANKEVKKVLNNNVGDDCDNDDDDWPSNYCYSENDPPVTIVYSGKDTIATCNSLEKGKRLLFRVKVILKSLVNKNHTLWKSNFLKVVGGNSSFYEWKPCPKSVIEDSQYEIDEENSCIATQIHGSESSCTKGCTIICSEPLPLGEVVSWRIKYVKATKNGCCGGVGVAPIDIDQSEENVFKYGWYYNPYASELRSGPPQKLRGKKYGPSNKSNGEVVKTGDEIGVTMDMINGTLSFEIDGKDYGVAISDIPLDKPLVPCVLTGHLGDSVEIICV